MSIKVEKNQLSVNFSEVKGNPVKNYEMYTEGIKVLGEIGRVATLKIVEAVARVNVKSLWKLGNSEKTGLPYNSINEWAISEFGFSKSHVSEILTVAKECCDPETGIPFKELAGYGYTQLLAFTKNPKLLTKVMNGEEIEGLTLSTSAKDIKNFAIEDKSNKSDNNDGGKSDNNDEDKSNNNDEDKSNKSDNKPKTENKQDNSNSTPHEERDITFKMGQIEEWFNTLEEVHGIAESVMNAETKDEILAWCHEICLHVDGIQTAWQKALGLV